MFWVVLLCISVCVNSLVFEAFELLWEHSMNPGRNNKTWFEGKIHKTGKHWSTKHIESLFYPVLFWVWPLPVFFSCPFLPQMHIVFIFSICVTFLPLEHSLDFSLTFILICGGGHNGGGRHGKTGKWLWLWCMMWNSRESLKCYFERKK